MGGIYWAPPVHGGFGTAGVIESWILLVLGLLVLSVKVFAFANALLYSAESYVAADKLNKPTWSILLGVAILLQFVPILSLVNLALTVAAFVYIADVRPALAGLRRR